MFEFEFLSAQHGDCTLVRWGEGGRVMVVDGGPAGVYENVLKPRLARLQRPNGAIPVLDVVCISHVDDDHIVGIVRLLTELRRARRDPGGAPFEIERFWHNSVEELVDANAPGLVASVAEIVKAARAERVVAASYNQGRDARDAAAALNLDGNPPFGGPIVQGQQATIHGLEVVVIGPSQLALDKLARKWRAAKKRQDKRVIAAAYADRSIPNLSSIALHLTYGPHTALMTGDASGDHLLRGLEDSGLVAANGMLEVDVLKLPHHGSQNNVEPAFFERIRARHYVISADGIKHDHPGTETLNWLVDSRGNDDLFTVHLTNPIPKAEVDLDRLRAGRKFTVEVASANVRASVVTLNG